ncbi:MAG: 3-phosphoshikimate 1-carboxyvinyltransferase [Deltaproteobacteria bacterium]|nr:3-phosphoshikimate 1-carboxyvinyltransferase [Deltaproteobacteria bacterium]MBN2671088.1 3-phosphoshikimate 1-carboxyvinyltransferase [Deltaproteobacteria bacterium]
MRSVSPGNVWGQLKAPPSKSMAQRAVAAAALIAGESTIVMGTPCDDIESSLRAAVGLGATVNSQPGEVRVFGRRQGVKSRIHCGEAGLSLRMFSAVAALFDTEIQLEAGGSLAKRPVDMLEVPLRQLGAQCRTERHLPPVTVCGPLRPGEVRVDATESSQFLTGLLIALANLNGESTILAPGLKSKPYVQMTVDLLQRLGAAIEPRNDLEEIHISGRSDYAPFTYDVPGDWSGASFLLVAAAIAGELTVTGIDPKSSQADRKIIDAIAAAGATVHVESNAVTVKQAPLSAFEFDATHCPDLFPPLAALAANCEGVSRVRGVHRLTNKESNRERAIIEEFGKLGIQIETINDVMHITGGQTRGANVSSHNDHRMAMAAAVAALTADDVVHIEGDESINKSYPDFFTDMAKVGANIQ